MPPQSVPKSENIANTLHGSYEPPSSVGPHYTSRDPTKRLDAGQSSGTTLPPVASLTGYGALPPTTPATDVGSPVSFRPLGVRGMLNPSADLDLVKPIQRVSQSPGRSVSAAFPAQQTPMTSPRVRKRKDEVSPARTMQNSVEGRQGRRVLTPKSPSLRSASQHMRASPSAGSQGSHFHNEGRTYTAEQADMSAGNVPPLPPLPSTLHGHPAPLHHHEYPVSTAPSHHTNSSVAYSASNPGYMDSPGSSSNMADRETTSPFRPTPAEPTSRSTSSQQPMSGHDQQNRSAARAYGVGQTAYQMHISTDQGPVAIPVEIDLQQASKSADEKRKRNAGASARFRQRRKEKEQAASAHITDLQRELRSIADQRDHYRTERNFFRDMFARTPGAQIPPRPATPQFRSGGGQMMATPEPPPVVDYGRRDVSEPSPAQRRRTSDYQPSFANAALGTPSYPPQYAPQPPPPQGPSYSLPPPSLPAPMQDPRGQPGPSFLAPHQVSQQQQHPPPPPPASAGTGPAAPHHRLQRPDLFRRDMNAR